jgi:hypothetical protein
MLSKVESAFLDYADEFLDLLLRDRGINTTDEFRQVTSRLPFPVQPTIVEDYRTLSLDEKSAIVHSYSKLGVAHLIVGNHSDSPTHPHPLFVICDQLKEELSLHYPLLHPLEGHPEAVARFGPGDGTVKIYNLPKPVGGTSYREVAETSDPFEVHLDGLGSGGTVQTVILYMDSAPLFGGFTFFYDMLSLGGALAAVDMEAFRHLFLPNAFTAIRPRGKGALKVVTPVFYINELGQPQTFYRKDSGEYRMVWRAECAPLERARAFFHNYTNPFSPGSFFILFTRPGCACLSRNRDLAHGRTGFIDGGQVDQRRLLSRKWFMTSAEHSVYKHVPGTAVRHDVAQLFPLHFGPDQLIGEWIYDESEDTNHRIK